MLKKQSGRRIENITCTEQAFPEFPHLLFGDNTDKSIQYFDASEYLNKSGLNLYSAEDFLTAYSHPIGALVNAYELDPKKVCIENTEGHILIDSSLVYLFISYTNSDFLAYINSRIDELLRDGIAISDHHLLKMAKERIPDEVFLGIDNEPRSD